MGQFSSWSLSFKRLDGENVLFDIGQANKVTANSSFLKSGLTKFDVVLNSDGKEAFAEWETTSFNAQEDIENDMKLLSEIYPHLVFQAHGDIDNGDPDFYINAKAGMLEWNYPEVTYPGFQTIFYDEADKPSSPGCPYTEDDIRLAISDMNTLTEMVKAKAPAGTFSCATPTTVTAAWALEYVLANCFGKEK